MTMVQRVDTRGLFGTKYRKVLRSMTLEELELEVYERGNGTTFLTAELKMAFGEYKRRTGITIQNREDLNALRGMQ